jgi:hypothetical protein
MEARGKRRAFSVRVHLASATAAMQQENDAPCGVRQHDAALPLRDMSRVFLPSQPTAFKKHINGTRHVANYKAATCRRTPKERFFLKKTSALVAQARCTLSVQFNILNA